MAYSTTGSSAAIKFDKKLQTVFRQVTNDKDPINWCLAKYDEKSNLVELEDSGTDGMKGFKARLQKNAGKIQFGGFSVIALDKPAKSRRVRFVFVVYSGSGNVQKFKWTYLTKEIGEKLFNGAALSLDFNAGTIGDLTEKAVAKRLFTGTGGHKPTHFEFSKDVEISVESLAATPKGKKGDSASPAIASEISAHKAPKPMPAAEPEAAPEAAAAEEPAPEPAPEPALEPAPEEAPAEAAPEAGAEQPATEEGAEYTYNQ